VQRSVNKFNSLFDFHPPERHAPDIHCVEVIPSKAFEATLSELNVVDAEMERTDKGIGEGVGLEELVAVDKIAEGRVMHSDTSSRTRQRAIASALQQVDERHFRWWGESCVARGSGEMEQNNYLQPRPWPIDQTRLEMRRRADGSEENKNK
jgi:hypothetical protein